MNNFNDNLKKARILKGLGQQELADALEITQASISQFEKGKRIPTLVNIKKIANILDVTPEELTGDDNNIIGKKQLMEKIKGLSPSEINKLNEYAELLILRKEYYE